MLVGCTDGATDAGTEMEARPSPLTGDYQLLVAVESFGGLLLNLQLEIEAERSSGGETLTQVDLRAANAQGESDVLASVSDVTLGEGGTFELPFGAWTLPGPYAPLGADIDVDVTLEGQFNAPPAPPGMCGIVRGDIVTFDISFGDSTFGGAPVDAPPPPPSCAGPPQEIPRIETCPPLVDGANEDFPSAGLERSFLVHVPDTYDAATPAPLVFSFHGFGGNAAGFLSQEMRDAADAMGAILIVPDGGDRGGTPGFDVVAPPVGNTDLVLFDDLVTCASEQWNIDADRIHSTGMSNGGLMTGYLMSHRDEVLASVAPLSGGISGPYASEDAIPVLATWGGEDDFAFEQDFHQLSRDMVDASRANGQFVIACDHGMGHTYDDGWWSWVFEFLADHPGTLAEEPYTEVPASFPDWCTIAP